jgi:phage gp29-like protein
LEGELLMNLFGYTVSIEKPQAPKQSVLGKGDLPNSFISPTPGQRWTFKLPSKLDPETVVSLIDSALSGDLSRQSALFDVMEDAWYRLSKNLNDVRNAVADLPWAVNPFCPQDGEATPEAEAKAALVTNVFKQMMPSPTSVDEAGFRGALYNLLDAHARGISVQEIEWGTIDGAPFTLKDGTWGIRAIRHIPGRYYGYPQSGNVIDHLMLAPAGFGLASGGLVEFPQDKFIIAKSPVRSGHPANIALLRALAMWWVASTYGFSWLCNYAQLFGMPFRWATYDPSNEPLKKTIMDMLAGMGSCGYAAFPTGTAMNFLAASGDAKDNPQSYLLNAADKACDILILGQTLTTDVGSSGSRALGDVHAEIRFEIIQHAAHWLEEVINDQLIPATMRMNYGEVPDDCPTFAFEVEEPKDSLQMAQRDQVLVGTLQMPVGKKWLYKRHGIPMPQDGEKIFTAPKSAPTDSPPPGGLTAREGYTVHAKARKEQRYQTMANELMTDLTGVSSEWLKEARPIFAELVRKADDGAVSDADFSAAVQAAAKAMPHMFDKLDADALALALEREMGAAVVNGALEGARQRS